ncbi:MAG: GHKL domain-containing protein [Bdellovibrionales bacterium]|nr:GHKL domain-containing protein [Bdellovibrionales bacterium]
MNGKIRSFLDYFISESYRQKFSDVSEFQTSLRHARMIIAATLITGIATLLMIVGRVSLEREVQPSMWAPVFIVIYCFTSPFIGKYLNNFVRPFLILYFIGIHAIFYRVITTGGLASIVMSWYTIIPIIGMLLIGKKAAIASSVIIFIHLGLIYFAPEIGLPINNIVHQNNVRIVVFSTCLLIVIGVSYAYFGITEQYKDRVIDVKEKLGRQEKLASIGILAGGVAHEVNNPLMVLMGRINMIKNLIKNENIDRGKIEEQLDKSIKMIERISEVTSSLLKYSGAAIDQSRSPMDLLGFVQEIKEELRGVITEKGITLLLNTPTESLIILTNKAQMKQVLLNLLQNAFDAVESSSEKIVSLEVKEDEEGILLSVSDYGEGIPEKYREKIMDPYFTTKKLGEGRGLGLSVSKGIVEQHGGKLVYDTSVSYTKFSIVLPLNVKVGAPSHLIAIS